MAPAGRRYRVVIVETTVYTAVVRAERPDLAMTQLKNAIRRRLMVGSIRKDGPVLSDMRATLLDDEDEPGKSSEKTS